LKNSKKKSLGLTGVINLNIKMWLVKIAFVGLGFFFPEKGIRE